MSWWSAIWNPAYVAPPVEMRAEPRAVKTFSVTVPPEIVQGGFSLSVPRVSRKEALSVPAVARSRNLIAGTLGALPMHLHDDARRVIASPLLDCPEGTIPRSVTMTRTFEDMLFDGVAWWLVTVTDGDGYPKRVVRLDPSVVQEQDDGRVYVDGRLVPDSKLIRFDSPNPALLAQGARTIRTSLKLEQAAARYADEPLPLGYFSPVEGVDPEPDEVDEALSAWATARNSRATGYVGAALVYRPLSWSPEQLQLADARQHAVLEIARCTGIDPEELGVSTTSRSYSNLELDQLKFRNQTLMPFAVAAEERLSMPDVAREGHYARTLWDAFLRSDTLSRYQAYDAGLRVGALGADEIRQLEDKPALPATTRPVIPQKVVQ